MIPLTGICYIYGIKQKKASSGIQMENKNVSDDHLGPSSVHPIYIRPTHCLTTSLAMIAACQKEMSRA